MTALDRGGRWARRVTALVILALGTVDLLAAARVGPVPRAGVLGVDYVVAALVGSRYVVLAAGLTAVMTVRGLLQGKRAAWWAALAAAVTSLPGHPVTDANVASQAAALAALVTLLGCRRVFIARADPALARRGVAMLVAGELAVFGYAAAGLYQLDTDFRHPNTLASALPNAARLLFLLPVHLEPTTQHGHAFVDSVRVAALLVACAGLSRLVAAVVGQPGHAADRAQVARLLRRHGRTGLAHFHLLDDKNWVISSEHGAFIGYKVVGTTAVALGEPVGDPHSCRVAALDFLQLCALNGWTPVFHQVTEAGRALLESVGMKALHIGEEAIVDVRTWSPQRREYKSLRSALRRCERAGYRVIDLPHPVDDPTLAQLKEVSDAWLAAGGHRERTFTLGHFDADYLRSTPIVAVIDAKGTVQAFANLLPSYQSLDGSFDLMRRRPEAVNGVMDYLFVALIERFRAAGYAGMNLGLAPLSGAGTGGGLADRVMRTLYQHGGTAFRFAGLRAFKQKWQPRWEPRYLAYLAETDLPKAALAVARAGELPDPRRPTTRAVDLLRRFPITVGFATLQLWLMTATTADRHLQHLLLRHFGLAWPDLAHGQLWRLVTAPLIQSKPGFVWSMIALLAVVLPLAEWRLGSRQTSWLFLLGDWASTIPVLLALKAAAAAGIAAAATAINQRDAGSSSGAYALIAAALWTLPAGRIRRIAVSGLLGCLAIILIVFHRLFDLQHLLSAVSTLAVLRLATDGFQSSLSRHHDQPNPSKLVCRAVRQGRDTRPTAARPSKSANAMTPKQTAGTSPARTQEATATTVHTASAVGSDRLSASQLTVASTNPTAPNTRVTAAGTRLGARDIFPTGRGYEVVDAMK